MTPAASDLRRRLAGLRPTPQAATERSPQLAVLLARIERMRCRRRQAGDVPATPDGSLAQRLGGELLAPGLLRIERRHSFRQPCGRRSLGDWLAGARELSPLPLERLCFFDCETSGLAGGTGTVAWMVGFARIDATAVVTRQYLIDRFASEPELLAAVGAELADAATLVSFNGKSFDLPLLATRCRLQRRELPPLAEHLDLLHPLRRRWRQRLPNCRLPTLEAELLGMPRQQDLPGSAAPAIWNALLAGRADTRLEAMARHNRLDLIGMCALLGDALAPGEVSAGRRSPQSAALPADLRD